MVAQKTPLAAFSAEDMRRIAPEEPRGERPSTTEEPNRALLRLAEAMGGLDAPPPYSPVVFVGTARVGEFLILCAAGLLVHLLHIAPHEGYAASYLVAIPAIAGATAIAFQMLHLNTISAFRTPIQTGFRIFLCWACVLLVTLATLFFLKQDGNFSRLWLVSWFGLGLVFLGIERFTLSLITRAMTRSGRLERRTVIVGGGKAGEELLDALSKQGDTDLRVFGVFDDRNDARSPNVVGGYPKLGNVSDLVTFARHTRVDLVIFTLPITAEERLLQMLRKLWVLPIDIRLAAHRNKLRFRPRSYSYIGDVPVLDVFDKPIADWDVVVKSVFDRVVGALALVVLSPVLLLTAIAVKLDSKGPVFFKQKRHGFNNEPVEVFKFRSLYADQTDHMAARQVTKDDPRVTRVGRFIRKTSLDELPQLFNVVFKGNLSLVGPRPHAVHAQLANRQYDDVVDGYFARHKVKPGITGWAQVNGWRGETDTPIKIQRRVEHDLAYIENWSIFFDIYILMITPFALTRTENAY